MVEGSTKNGQCIVIPNRLNGSRSFNLTERNSRVDADFESNEFMRLR